MAEPDLLELAEAVSDGGVVDWARLEREVRSDEVRRVVRNLRLVESLSAFHRREPPTLESGPTAQEPTFSWGGLQVLSLLGKGAFGEVYRAWDPKLQREVALKLLRPEHSGKDDFARVLHEARLMARVRHPNVVAVHGADRHDGRVGLWMERVNGRSLEDRMVEQGRLGAREAAILAMELCRALAAVHNAGLVHRDVKAANVLREEGGRILLMDFGAGSDAATIAEGSLSGTPQYIAPEVYEGRRAGPRSDLYSLGVLLYHLVTGAYPIDATSFTELRGKVARRESRLLRDERPDLPGAFVEVVERALAWDPEARFATAGQMEQALGAFLGGEAGAPGKRRIALAAGIVLAALAALAATTLFLSLRDRAVPPPPEPAAEATTGYTVEASLQRVHADGRRERLTPPARLAIGDRLALEFRSSVPVHLYVINEDEHGHAFALFPLPGMLPQNPLSGEKTWTLPGRDGAGAETFWKVDTAGGREHLLVLASPERLVEFEAEMARLPRPAIGSAAQPIPDEAKVLLRGIGGLARVEHPASPTGSGAHLFEMAERLAGGSEVVRGPWLRRIELENPSK